MAVLVATVVGRSADSVLPWLPRSSTGAVAVPSVTGSGAVMLWLVGVAGFSCGVGRAVRRSSRSLISRASHSSGRVAAALNTSLMNRVRFALLFGRTMVWDFGGGRCRCVVLVDLSREEWFGKSSSVDCERWRGWAGAVHRRCGGGADGRCNAGPGAVCMVGAGDRWWSRCGLSWVYRSRCWFFSVLTSIEVDVVEHDGCRHASGDVVGEC